MAFGLRAASGAPKKIYINGRFYDQRLSGVQRYARQIVHELDLAIGKSEIVGQYILLVPRKTVVPVMSHVQVRKGGFFGGNLWVQTALPFFSRAGVLLNLTASGPLFRSRQITIIHDAAVFRHPKFYSRSYQIFHKIVEYLLSRRSLIGTVSEFSRGELAHYLRLDSKKIFVAPNAADQKFIGGSNIVGNLGLRGKTYFVFLGSMSPNKNLPLVAKALACDGLEDAVVVAIGAMDAKVFGTSELTRSNERVLVAGRLDDDEVVDLMRSACALIFPSFYEGFGLPPLEAMANDCPVLASDIPAVREVCGEAAEYFSPFDELELAAAMRKAIRNLGDWRLGKISLGRLQVKAFNWHESALKIASACSAEAGRA